MKPGILLIVLFSVLSLATVEGQKNNKKIIVTGSVIDSLHRPVANAIIKVDDNKTSYYTDSKGNFKIKVKPGTQKLFVFTVPKGMVEIPYEGKTKMTIILEALFPDQHFNKPNNPGDEVINVGYGSKRKKDLVSQVNKIDATNKKFVAYTSIYEMLKGEVPGVRVNGTSVRIQGASSFISSTEPLFVVDAVIVSSIDYISPQMVKSIEVLKGPSAAIYGERGANGVILINLLTGSDNK